LEIIEMNNDSGATISLFEAAQQMLDLLLKDHNVPEGTHLDRPEELGPTEWKIHVEKPDGSRDSFIFSITLPPADKLS
jgi:hypothetical protein